MRRLRAAQRKAVAVDPPAAPAQNPYNAAGLSTRILTRVDSSSVHSSSRSSIAALDGAGFQFGCGQLLARTQRSGFAFASARQNADVLVMRAAHLRRFRAPIA